MEKNSLRNEFARKVSILVDKFHTFILRADKLYGDIEKGKYRKIDILFNISSITFGLLFITMFLADKNIIDVDIFDYKFKIALAITLMFNHVFWVSALFALYILSKAIKLFFPIESELKIKYANKNERTAQKTVVIILILYSIYVALFSEKFN
jgi:hypothetical protein